MIQRNIGIIGSGISGLSSAFFARKKFPNSKITIYEQQNKIGGVIQQQIFENKNIIHEGPSQLNKTRSSMELLKIVDELNLLDQLIPSKNSNDLYVYYDKKVRAFPRSQNFITVFFKFIKQNPKALMWAFDIGSKQVQNNQDQDISILDQISKDLVIGNLHLRGVNKFMNTYVLNPVMRTIYKNNPALLSSDLFLKQEKVSEKLQKFINKDFQKVQQFNFKGGLNQFTEQIVSYLESQGNFEIKKENEIKSIKFLDDQTFEIKNQKGITFSHDFLISTQSAKQISQMIQQNSQIDQLDSHLREIVIKLMTFSTLVEQKKVVLVYKADQLKLKDYKNSLGIFIPEIENRPIVHINFMKYQFENLIEDNLEVVGVTFNEQFQKNENQDLKNQAKIQLKEILGIDALPLKEYEFSWENFHPFYQIGQYQRSVDLLNNLNQINPNFKISSNFVFSGNIPDLVLQAKVMVEQLN